MEVLNHLGRGQEKNLVGCEKVQPPRDLFAGGIRMVSETKMGPSENSLELVWTSQESIN